MGILSSRIEKYNPGEKLPGYSSLDFVTTFLDYCRKNKLKVFVINSPSETKFESEDGTITKVTPPTTITPLKNGEGIEGKSLLVSGKGMNFTVWFGDHEAKPEHMDAYLYEDEGLTKVDVAQVHVFEKNLPKNPKPTDLQQLRSVSGNVAHMQYFRQMGKLDKNQLMLLEDKLSVFDDGSEQVVQFFKAFAASIKK